MRALGWNGKTFTAVTAPKSRMSTNSIMPAYKRQARLPPFSGLSARDSIPYPPLRNNKNFLGRKIPAHTTGMYADILANYLWEWLKKLCS